MASKIHQLLKKSGGLIKSTNISCLLNKHQYRPVVSSPLTHYYRSEERQGFVGFLSFCTMPSKIHLFKKSAIEAGTPENYYLNPSDNLMKVTTKWNVVEHEDVINLTINMHDLGDYRSPVCFSRKEKFIDIIVVGEEGFHNEKPAGYADNNGLKYFSIEMNPRFLDLRVKGDDIKGWEGIARLYISKLTPEEIRDYAARMHICKLTPEEMKNNAGARMNDSKPKADDKKSKYYTATINIS